VPGRALTNRYRTVVVAGGTGTLGGAIAERILARGYATVTLSRRSDGLVGGRIPHLACDATDKAALDECLREVDRAFPPMWALVNCVGCNTVRNMEAYGSDELRRLLDVNLYAAMLLSQVAIPRLKRGGGGRLIHVASQAGLDPQGFNAVYSAAKAGVVALTKALARELAPSRIATVAVCPGDVESSMLDKAMDEFATLSATTPTEVRKEIGSLIPLGRFVRPAEIADLVTAILEIETSAFTGASVVVAGGRTCH
jgi:NAD(P)-dependent dehydrogenase (short-subunit alcohol dehydrogenase family)